MQKTLIYFAYKITDGLYIGNQRSHNERDFLNSNKITHIINTASHQFKVTQPVATLNFEFEDNDEQVIITGDIADRVFAFLELASQSGEGALICSMRGQSRALTLMTLYLMKKYAWGLYKTLQFLNSRRKDFEIRAAFLRQLVEYEKLLQTSVSLSKDWIVICQAPEALLMRNTFLNAQIQTDVIEPKKQSQKQQIQQVSWADSISTVIAENIIEEAAFSPPHQQKSILKPQTSKRLFQRRQLKSGSFNEEDCLVNRVTSPQLQELTFQGAKPMNDKYGWHAKKQKFTRSSHLQSATKEIQQSSVKKLSTNTKQLLDCYLDTAMIKPIVSIQTQKKFRARLVTPCKESRARSISQQAPTTNTKKYDFDILLSGSNTPNTANHRKLKRQRTTIMLSHDNCTWVDSDNHQYHLELLDKQDAWHVEDTQNGMSMFNMVYVFNFCHFNLQCHFIPVAVYEGLEVMGSITDNCDVVGLQTTRTVQHIPDHSHDYGIQITFHDDQNICSETVNDNKLAVPNKPRTAVFNIVCSQSNGEFEIVQGYGCTTMFEIKHQVGCPNEHNIAYHIVELILLVTMIYLLIGASYNHQQGLKGVDLFPNKEVWKNAFLLVIDGVKFVKYKLFKQKQDGYQVV